MSTAIAAPFGQAREQEQSWRKWAILVAASLGALLEVIDTSIVNVALTDMQASLGATLSEVGWVVTIYAIANVIILPLTAWLGDRFGKKTTSSSPWWPSPPRRCSAASPPRCRC